MVSLLCDIIEQLGLVKNSKAATAATTTSTVTRQGKTETAPSLLLPPITIFNELSSKPNDNEFSTFGEKLRDLQIKLKLMLKFLMEIPK